MVELITEILIYLGLAALIGLVLGYLIWGWGSATRIASARADGAAAARASAERETALRGKLTACKAEVARLTQEVEQLSARLEPYEPADSAFGTAPVESEDAPSKPDGLLASPPDTVDDLKRIKGIGAVMEEVLNERGIYLYSQIASLSEREADWVNDAIEAFPGRIHRDRWIQQAKQLMREYHDEPYTEAAQPELS